MRGRIIDFEGIDGSGKSTQAKLLASYLAKNRKKFSFYKFPQYQATFHGKTISKFLRGEFGLIGDVSPYLISLAYALDRVSAKEAIFDDLNDGKIAVCDRYAPSNKAHQAAKLPPASRARFIRWLDELDYKVNKMPREDYVILLDIPVEVSLQLLKKASRKKDIHEADGPYLEETRRVYLRLAKADRGHWLVVDCVDEEGRLKSRQRIHQEIIKLLKKRKFI